jgi:hypothetical protein
MELVQGVISKLEMNNFGRTWTEDAPRVKV